MSRGPLSFPFGIFIVAAGIVILTVAQKVTQLVAAAKQRINADTDHR